MFCRKCGKQIDYEAEFCKECQEMDAFFGDNKPTVEEPSLIVEQEKPVLEGNRKEGFGKALAATIMGAIAYFFVIIALGILTSMLGGDLDDLEMMPYESIHELTVISYDPTLMAIMLITAGISIFLAIPSLILGIQSIKCFFRQKKAGKVRPVATLVLGIVSVVIAASVLSSALVILPAAALLA